MSRHVLIPMDDSEPARAALEHACALFPEDRLTVLHVVDDLEAHYGGSRSADETAAGEPAFFDDAASIADAHGTAVETQVVEGTPADAILEFAREEAVDQIVLGSEGRSGVSRLLLGSVAEQVARESRIPVTIVR